MGRRKVPVRIARHGRPIAALAGIGMTAIAIRLRRSLEIAEAGEN